MLFAVSEARGANARLCAVAAGPALGSIWILPMILLPTHLPGAGSDFLNTAGQIGRFLLGILIGWYINLCGGDFFRRLRCHA